MVGAPAGVSVAKPGRFSGWNTKTAVMKTASGA
jgi:hypothetical protein